MVVVDNTSMQTCYEGSGNVGISESSSQRVRVLDGHCHFCTRGHARLVPFRVGVPDQAPLQPSIQQRSPNPKDSVRWQEEQVKPKSNLIAILVFISGMPRPNDYQAQPQPQVHFQ